MKTTDDFRSLPSYALPSALNFENYIKVFTTSPMLNYFKNSIIITVGVLIPLLLISFMAGFALSKIQFRGNKKILSYFLLGLMLPFQVALIPLFTIFSKIGNPQHLSGSHFATNCVLSVILDSAVLFIQ